jgi:tRNA A37 methylthiotransferase MiaB
MRVFIHGLNSCGMRNTNIQRWRDFLLASNHELVSDPKNSDVVLLWTCAFRADVRDNSLSVISNYVKEYGDKVVAAGCLPDIDPELLYGHYHGRIVNWRDEEKKLTALFGSPSSKLSQVTRVLVKPQLYEDEATFRTEYPNADAPFVGRFIQIYVSEGCPFECTYCAERLAFPPYKSFPENEIMQAVSTGIARNGKPPVMLLADSIGDYGIDTRSDLPTLIRKLNRVHPGIKIGLQGLNPFHFLKFYDEIVEFLHTGLIVHLQIPIQSASGHILQLMKRPYNRTDIDRIFNTLNTIGFKDFDTHILVGFPGEQREDFEETVQFVLCHQPKYVLVNGYMESPRAASAKLPMKIDLITKCQRIAESGSRLRDSGILCNCDDSDFSRERFRRINSIGGQN